ncbi:MAG: hypothetical protein U9R47_04085 [Actinomycetota bacterium]|nr:hypothetical protein [Actinomycetota bacterium]
MWSWLRAHGTTVTSILIASVLTVSFGYVAVDSLLGAADPSRLDGEFGRSALSFASAGSGTNAGAVAANASAIVGFVIGSVVGVSVIIVIGLVFRREWARETGLVIYGLLGLLTAAVSVGGLAADPPAPAAWVGVLTSVANFTVVGLLFAPATARDFRHRSRRRVADPR